MTQTAKNHVKCRPFREKFSGELCPPPPKPHWSFAPGPFPQLHWQRKRRLTCALTGGITSGLTGEFSFLEGKRVSGPCQVSSTMKMKLCNKCSQLVSPGCDNLLFSEVQLKRTLPPVNLPAPTTFAGNGSVSNPLTRRTSAASRRHNPFRYFSLSGTFHFNAGKFR